MVWGQRRHVIAGDVELDGLDMDITVNKPKDDPLEFTVQVWNVRPETWNRIEKGDLVNIELGWENGPSETVIVGEITRAEPQPDGGGRRFDLEGIEESEAALYARIADSWRDAQPHQIAEDLASQVGLGAQTDTAGVRIRGDWAITGDRRVRDWLDDLEERAEELTESEWEWFAEQGRLFFVRRDSERTEAPHLSWNTSLASIGPLTTEDEDVEGQLEFEAMLDPAIRKGAVVMVETDRFSGPYRVREYEFSSSTVTGDHLVRGTLLPIKANYTVERPRRGFGRARRVI